VTFASSLVIPPDTVVNVADNSTPTFRPTQELLWAPGQIEALEARLADGRVIDLTSTNKRVGVAFLAFGENAGPRDVLRMTFACRGESGLFPKNRAEATGALWPIGVRAATQTADTSSTSKSAACCQRRVAATLIVGNERTELEVRYDSTEGLLQTGVLLLALDSVPGSPQTFTIEFRCRDGFPRPPQLLRIEPNVIPIMQGRSISRELHPANGIPDWSFTLNVPGLR